MPRKIKRPCKHPFCPNLTANENGYCNSHQSDYKSFRSKDTRPSRSRRGYNWYWYKVIRPKVLKNYGIPKENWHLYDVDHEPPYNPDIESDHEKYTLIPRLRSEHSRKTAKFDGGFGNPREDRGTKSLQVSNINRGGQVSSQNVSDGERGLA